MALSGATTQSTRPAADGFHQADFAALALHFAGSSGRRVRRANPQLLDTVRVGVAVEALGRPAERAEDSRPDPVLARLHEALATTEAATDDHSRICGDALRLAILMRQVTRAEIGAADEITTTGSIDEAGRTIASLQKWRLQRVTSYIDENLDNKVTLQHLATVAGLSRMHFAAQFRATMGMRPHEYVLRRRIQRAVELLAETELPLVEVALAVGFHAQSHFTTVFGRFVGEPPYRWRRTYRARATPLPRVLERS